MHLKRCSASGDMGYTGITLGHTGGTGAALRDAEHIGGALGDMWCTGAHLEVQGHT